jgi:hypothetical protein
MNLDEVLPQLIEKGHQQVNLARMFGQFAVQTGTKEARKRVEQVQEQVGMRMGTSSGGPRTDRPGAASATSTGAARRAGGDGDGASAGSAGSGTGSDAAAVTAESAPLARDLAIPDYDALSASQVVPRLAGLAGDELDAVRRYEAANRGRKTILSKIAQLAG